MLKQLSAQTATLFATHIIAFLTLIANKLGFYPSTTKVRTIVPVIVLNIILLSSFDVMAVLEALMSYNAMM